ncbi:hypothetical protein H9P43_002550 [Blastocladiella emersonii ATCC 22665]|nr:hypothetical protein H9P43_002550 [Blastocladiella emersonii ATCC 22665]
MSSSGGVTFAIKWTEIRDVAYFVGLLMHALGVVLLAICVMLCVRGFLGARSRFWLASAIGCVVLLPTPFVEIVYILAYFSKNTLFANSSYVSLAGDWFLRVGFALVTACRSYRVSIVYSHTAETASPSAKPSSSSRRHRAAGAQNALPGRRPSLAFPILTAVIWVLLGISAVAITRVRLLEVKYVEQRRKRQYPADLLDARDLERIVSGIAFASAFVANLTIDALFHAIIVRGIKDRVGWRDHVEALTPYLPAIVCDVAYLVFLVWAQIMPTDPTIPFIAITLNRFAPCLESYTFFRHAIPQTRALLQRSSSNHTGGHGGAGGGASGSRKHSTHHTTTIVSPASAVSPLDYYLQPRSAAEDKELETFHGPTSTLATYNGMVPMPPQPAALPEPTPAPLVWQYPPPMAEAGDAREQQYWPQQYSQQPQRYEPAQQQYPRPAPTAYNVYSSAGTTASAYTGAAPGQPPSRMDSVSSRGTASQGHVRTAW